MGINYGANKIRFTGVVPVGSKIRGRYKLLDVKDVDDKTILLTWGVTGELEGRDKPILIAESLSRRRSAVTMTMRVRALHCADAGCLLTVLAPFAQLVHAQSYPSRPVRLIVPFPPGGGNDILARTVGNRLTEVFGQQVVVDNRAGAGGVIGATLAAQAVPDGYTLFLGSVGNLAQNPALKENLAYDPVQGFRGGQPAGDLGLHPARSIRPCRRSRCRSSSRWRKPRRASSTTPRPARARPCTWRWSSSGTRPARTCCTCLTRAPRRS